MSAPSMAACGRPPTRCRPRPRWQPLTDDAKSLSIGALAFDPTDASHQTLVAGTGRYSSNNRTGTALIGLMRTTDGGASWDVIDGGKLLRNAQIVGRGAARRDHRRGRRQRPVPQLRGRSVAEDLRRAPTAGCRSAMPSISLPIPKTPPGSTPMPVPKASFRAWIAAPPGPRSAMPRSTKSLTDNTLQRQDRRRPEPHALCRGRQPSWLFHLACRPVPVGRRRRDLDRARSAEHGRGGRHRLRSPSRRPRRHSSLARRRRNRPQHRLYRRRPSAVVRRRGSGRAAERMLRRARGELAQLVRRLRLFRPAVPQSTRRCRRVSRRRPSPIAARRRRPPRMPIPEDW